MNEYNPFEQEAALIESIEEFLLKGDRFRGCEEEKKHFDALYSGYAKLFKSTKRLVKMSDRREAEMARLNGDLKSKNELLNSLSSKLSKYLSPQLYDSIFYGEQDVKLESKRKKLTVFFSDIVGFTEISDRLESEELTHSLNYYLNEMTNIALLYGATIDKYIGDAIMVFFGDPQSDGIKNDAISCVKMALAMRRRLEDLRSNRDHASVYKSFDIRMGVSTGYCTVGNFGSEDRMDYTIIGRAVNVASRLESRADKNEILISDETYELIRDEIACQKGLEMELKGVSQKMQTYKVLDLKENLDSSGKVYSKDSDSYKVYVDTKKLKSEERAELESYIKHLLQVIKLEEEQI